MTIAPVYVIAETADAACKVARRVVLHSIPCIYRDPLSAIAAYEQQPIPMQCRYYPYVVSWQLGHGSTAIMLVPRRGRG